MKKNTPRSESYLLKKFKQSTKDHIAKLGNTPLDNFTLDSFGKLLISPRYLGTYGQNNAPLNRTGSCIINTDLAHQPGTHWVALYITPNTIYIYDSFGRASHKLLKILTRQAKKLNKKIVDSEYDTEQMTDSVICGHLCLAWLGIVRDYGIKNALKI